MEMKPRRDDPQVRTFPGTEWTRHPPTPSTGASVGLSTRSTTSGRTRRICSPAHCPLSTFLSAFLHAPRADRLAANDLR
eukprot:3464256-Pyramimonas_sp.AAC.1